MFLNVEGASLESSPSPSRMERKRKNELSLQNFAHVCRTLSSFIKVLIGLVRGLSLKIEHIFGSPKICSDKLKSSYNKTHISLVTIN